MTTFEKTFTVEEITAITNALETGESLTYLNPENVKGAALTLGKKLYEFYRLDMPYGVQKARTGDPDEWLANELEFLIVEEEVA